MAKYGGIAKLYFEEPEVGYCLDGQKKPEELIKVEYNMFPENTFCSGSTFVSKSGGLEEDDGWIISYVHNEDSNISEVCSSVFNKITQSDFKILRYWYTLGTGTLLTCFEKNIFLLILK